MKKLFSACVCSVSLLGAPAWAGLADLSLTPVAAQAVARTYGVPKSAVRTEPVLTAFVEETARPQNMDASRHYVQSYQRFLAAAHEGGTVVHYVVTRGANAAGFVLVREGQVVATLTQAMSGTAD